ncbi:MAG: elongation factor P [Phycisphaerales bacterium]
MRATNIRPGMAIQMDGRLFVVTEFEHRTPGNLRAFIQIKIKDVNTGQYLEKRLASTDEVEATTLDRRQMEYLYSDSTGHTFMDLETYDQFVLSDDVLGNAMLYLRPNTQVSVTVHEGNPLFVELPGSVELSITDTPPGIKGATVTNQLKEATCETGLKTKVPQFINNGDVIKVSTNDGAYQSRA